MKKIVFIFVLALGFAGNCHGQTWTFVQNSIATYCLGPWTTCNFSFQGNAIQTASTQDVWIVTSNTTNNVTISSVSGGGGTWVHCPNCAQYQASVPRATDAWYNLTGNPNNSAQITVTLSGSSGSIGDLQFIELMPPTGSTASFDTSGTTFTSSCTTCTGVALTTAATDAIFQQLNASSSASWNSWSSPYLEDYGGGGTNLNSTTGAQTAPTVRTGGGAAMFMALAFKSSLGTFTPPPSQFSVVNYANSGLNGINCSPSCTLNIPTTGSGHLLYLQAGSLGTRITAVSGGGTWVVPSGANTCQVSSSSGGINGSMSCAYLLSSSSGTTTLNITTSGSLVHFFEYWEVSSASGALSLDVQGATVNASSFTPAGQSLTPIGTNDVIFYSMFVSGGTSARTYMPLARTIISGHQTEFFPAQAGGGVLLNSGSTPTTPHWANQQNNQTFVTGVAFKASATATRPAPPTGLVAVVN